MDKKDVPTVAKIYKDANPHATIKEIEEWTARYVKLCPEFCFVLEKDGKIIGASSGYMKNKVGYLEDIALIKKFRRMGLGSKLMIKILESFKKSGCRKVVGDVHFKNAYTLPFDYKYGFRMVKIIKDGFGPKHDLIKIEKLI
jgi:L-amino acid N-acyltransferase YncA